MKQNIVPNTLISIPFNTENISKLQYNIFSLSFHLNFKKLQNRSRNLLTTSKDIQTCSELIENYRYDIRASQYWEVSFKSKQSLLNSWCLQFLDMLCNYHLLATNFCFSILIFCIFFILNITQLYHQFTAAKCLLFI